MWKSILPFISSEISGISEKNLKCYYCNREIRAKEVYLDKKVENNDKDNKKDKLIKTFEPINRDNYYRIFNSEDDIDELNENPDTRNMLKKIKCRTKKDFKEKYIINLYNKEKGLNEIDANKFQKESKNCICDLVLDDNNKYGKAYMGLYKKFAELQNDKLKDLINKKYVLGVFKSDCINKINIQQIKEDEIFTFNIPKKFNFINVVFNSSYRRVIDTGKYEDYNYINLNLESIEKEMTELLLKNKSY